MSGAEAILVLGLLASIAGIVDFTTKALQRAKDTTGKAYNLLENIREAEITLPIVHYAVERTERQIKAGNLDESIYKDIRPILEDCYAKIRELNSTLGDCRPKDGASWLVREWKAISSAKLDKKVGDTSKVIRRHIELLKAALPSSEAVEAKVAEERPTRYFMVPVQWADQFTGREAELQYLDSRIRQNDKHVRVAIAGLGGLGKTRLASYYIRKFKSTEISVFWVHAGTAERMRSGSRDIAKLVGITGWDDPNLDVLKMVQEWFESEASGRWLLVYDNVDDVDLMYLDPRDRLSEYFPRSDRGSILMTTRNRQIGIKFAEAKNTITLAALNPSESVALMAAKLGSDEMANPDKWMKLAEKLDGIPLALVQAVSFMEEHEAITLDRYLELYEGSDSRKLQLLSENFEDTTRDSDSKNPIATTWIVTFEYMKEHQPLAANLLCLMSMFDTQAIPEILLRKLTREDSDPTLSFERALGVLQAYSLIRSAGPGQLRLSGRNFDLHRLVRLSTRNWLLMRSELNLWVAQAVDVLSLVYDELKKNDYATKSKTKSNLLSHALAVLSAPVLFLEDDIVVIPAVFNGQVLDGDHAEKGHICPSCTANILAEMCDLDKDMTRTLRMVSKAVAISTHVFGQIHPATLQHRSTQADTLWHLERPVEAEIIFVENLASYRAMYGLVHSMTTRTQRRLAETLNDQARYEEAELLLVPLIEICREEYGPNHLSTVEAMQNLANSLTLQGRGTEAMDLNATITKVAPNVACRFKLAKSYVNLIRYPEGESLCKQILDDRDALAQDPIVSIDKVWQVLGKIYCKQKRYDEAEYILLQALSYRQSMYGEYHKSTINTHFYLANVYSRQLRLPEAEAHQLAAVKPLTKQLPPLSSEVLEARWDLALIWLQQGKMEASKALALEVVAAAEEARGKSKYLQLSDFAGRLREFWGVCSDGTVAGEGEG